jgi:hypothetical protein
MPNNFYIRQFIFGIGILAVSLAIIFFARFVYAAWLSPANPFPSNIDEPLNIGESTQYKSGALELGGLSTYGDTNLAVVNGNVGIGTSTPSEKLALAGGNFLQPPKGISLEATTPLGTADGVPIFVSGNYAYLSDWGWGVTDYAKLIIFDIANPSNPISVVSFQYPLFGWKITQIFVSGNYAYLNTSGNPLNNYRFHVVDISNPSSPAVKASIDNFYSTNPTSGLYVSGNYAYITGSDYFMILDVSEPSNPKIIAKIFDFRLGTNEIYKTAALKIIGKYAYVASDSYLVVIDISDPYNPVIKGASMGGFFSYERISNGYAVEVSGKYAYVASNSSHSIVIFDISNPNGDPVYVNYFKDDGYLAKVNDIKVLGRNIYATAVNSIFPSSNYLTVVDISNPNNLFIVDALAGINDFNYPGSVYVSGKYAYISGFYSKNLVVVDISGIDSPAATIGSVFASDLGVMDNMSVGNNLYVFGGINAGAGGVKSDGPIQGNAIESTEILKLIPTDNQEECTAVKNVGKFYYDNSMNEPCYCSGAGGWVQFDGGGSCT